MSADDDTVTLTSLRKRRVSCSSPRFAPFFLMHLFKMSLLWHAALCKWCIKTQWQAMMLGVVVGMAAITNHVFIVTRVLFVMYIYFQPKERQIVKSVMLVCDDPSTQKWPACAKYVMGSTFGISFCVLSQKSVLMKKILCITIEENDRRALIAWECGWSEGNAAGQLADTPR